MLVLPTLFVVDPADGGIDDDLGDEDWAEDGESDDSDAEDVRMVPFVADKGKQPVRPSFCVTEVNAPPSRSRVQAYTSCASCTMIQKQAIASPSLSGQLLGC